jgi:hypothetical protein
VLLKANVFIRDGDGTKTIPEGGSKLSYAIKNLEKRVSVVLLVAQKSITRNSVCFSCVTTSGEIGHKYRTTKVSSIYT